MTILPAPRRGAPRRVPALAVTAVTLAATACACSGGGGAGTTALTIGAPPVVGLGDLFTAQSRNLFRAQGLTVTVRNLNGGAQLVPALQSGAVGVGQSNVVSVLQARQRHLNVRCFAAAFRSPSGPQLALVVSPTDKATVTTPSDLSGKTIAVNTLHNSNQLIAEKYLQAKGVNPGSVHFIGLPYPDMPGALSAGRVAAAITDEPFTTQTVAAGAAIMSPQPDAVIAPHPVYACWMATSGWLDEHKAVASKFTAALKQADAYMAAHPHYLASILPKYTKVTPRLATKVTLPQFGTGITAADIRPWADAAQQFHEIDAPVPASSVITQLP